ncbi:hypothetical protein ATANTOWER_001271 [Ataeniobius toweri]|uniref:Uncharacterized protein n=1 Tax=Ataeniobius toweri TaxID=208326 RepID=A0ABU7AWD0_9TELE|nr:hypothetical protein [Ataeniobius toweri]
MISAHPVTTAELYRTGQWCDDHFIKREFETHPLKSRITQDLSAWESGAQGRMLPKRLKVQKVMMKRD